MPNIVAACDTGGADFGASLLRIAQEGGGQVRAFLNLTRTKQRSRRIYSVQMRRSGPAWRTGHRAGWYTEAHATQLTLAHCEFIVSDACHARTMKTGKKTVHAWVFGTLVDWRICDIALDHPPATWVEVAYVPARGPYFFAAKTGTAVHEARTVHLRADGVWMVP